MLPTWVLLHPDLLHFSLLLPVLFRDGGSEIRIGSTDQRQVPSRPLPRQRPGRLHGSSPGHVLAGAGNHDGQIEDLGGDRAGPQGSARRRRSAEAARRGRPGPGGRPVLRPARTASLRRQPGPYCSRVVEAMVSPEKLAVACGQVGRPLALEIRHQHHAARPRFGVERQPATTRRSPRPAAPATDVSTRAALRVTTMRQEQAARVGEARHRPGGVDRWARRSRRTPCRWCPRTRRRRPAARPGPSAAAGVVPCTGAEQIGCPRSSVDGAGRSAGGRTRAGRRRHRPRRHHRFRASAGFTAFRPKASLNSSRSYSPVAGLQ